MTCAGVQRPGSANARHVCAHGKDAAGAAPRPGQAAYPALSALDLTPSALDTSQYGTTCPSFKPGIQAAACSPCIRVSQGGHNETGRNVRTVFNPGPRPTSCYICYSRARQSASSITYRVHLFILSSILCPQAVRACGAPGTSTVRAGARAPSGSLHPGRHRLIAAEQTRFLLVQASPGLTIVSSVAGGSVHACSTAGGSC